MEKIKYEDCYCDEQSAPELISIEVPIGKQRVLIKDIRATICLKCGAKWLDGKRILEVTKEVKDKLEKEKSKTNLE